MGIAIGIDGTVITMDRLSMESDCELNGFCRWGWRWWPGYFH